MYVILLSGGQTFITKKRSNGSADSSYGNNGFSVLVGITPVSAALQPDGKIVVAGAASSYIINDRSALARFNTDGSLDNTFSADGIQEINFSIASIAIQSDGKIVTAGSAADNGSSYFALARYNLDGSTDLSFSNDGELTTDFGFSETGVIPTKTEKPLFP